MKIAQHWRLNAQRYRLEGFRNPNGQLSLQPRPKIGNYENNLDNEEVDMMRNLNPERITKREIELA